VEGFRGTNERYTYEAFREKWRLYLDGKASFLKFNAVDDFLSMTGGEPTLNPGFLKILGLVRKTWPRKPIKLLTNARMLSYPDFAKTVLALGGPDFELKVPFFGYDEKTYSAISRAPGAFAEARAGLHNIFKYRSPGQRVTIRIILHKIQLRWLKELLDFLHSEFPGIGAVEFLYVEYEGFAEKNLKALAVPITECGALLGKLEPALLKFPEYHLLHFPLCALPRKLWHRAWRTLDPIKIVHAPQCGKCSARELCVGIHRTYAINLGVTEFKPVKSLAGVKRSRDPYRPVQSA
jgi:hypothetical protein